MPRFLLVTSNFPPIKGGSSVVYEVLCRLLANDAVVLAPEVDYRSGAPLADLTTIQSAAEFPIHRVRLLRPRQREGARAGGHSRWATLIRTIVVDLPVMATVFVTIARIVRRERIRVICLGEVMHLGWLAPLLRGLLGCKVIYYVHGEEITTRDMSRHAEFLKRWYLRWGHAIVAVSNFTRTALMEIADVDSRRISVIFNGIDVDRFTPRPKPAQLVARLGLEGCQIVVSVCRLVERKGVDRMLEAWPEVRKACPNARYVVVGAGELGPALEATAHRLGLDEDVRFVGAVDDSELVDFYALGDLFALPNRELPNGDTEGFGLVFLEANACGKAVISGRDGGVVDAVTDGVNGVVVDGDDRGEIAAAVIRLLRDDTERARLEAGGLARARSSSWKDRASQFERLIKLVEAGRLPSEDEERGEAQVRPVVRAAAPMDRVVLPAAAPPRLLVIIDAEEEFSWQSFSRHAVSVTNIAHQDAAQRLFAKWGVTPTYMVDYPVASQSEGYGPLREHVASGGCRIGAQLHPWVNPPYGEPIGSTLSFPGNLPAAIEAEKLRRLTGAIEDNFGMRPTMYRSGRYGFGPNTARILIDQGYRIDCSILPLGDFTRRDGPVFPDDVISPYWLDESRRLLEIPVTIGSVGLLASRAPALQSWLNQPAGRDLRLPGLFSRLGLLNRIRLSPEGTTVEEAMELTRVFAQRRGQRLFVISYHSSSLSPGHTPYVRNEEDLSRFLGWLDAYLAFFFEEMRGIAAMPEDILADAERLRDAPGV